MILLIIYILGIIAAYYTARWSIISLYGRKEWTWGFIIGVVVISIASWVAFISAIITHFVVFVHNNWDDDPPKWL